MNRHAVVAVASSARDLGPIVELLSALPDIWSQVFIIVQQFEPGQLATLLQDTLAKTTDHPVVLADDDVAAERGHIYITRPNLTLTVVDGRIRVGPGADPLQGPGDALFTSLAADRVARSIGVVLSGGGSDGALGTRAIQKVGGSTFAQYPGSARFPSMPISAIDTGSVGSVLRPNEIAHELTRLSRINARAEDNSCATASIRELAIAS